MAAIELTSETAFSMCCQQAMPMAPPGSSFSSRNVASNIGRNSGCATALAWSVCSGDETSSLPAPADLVMELPRGVSISVLPRGVSISKPSADFDSSSDGGGVSCFLDASWR